LDLLVWYQLLHDSWSAVELAEEGMVPGPGCQTLEGCWPSQLTKKSSIDNSSIPTPYITKAQKTTLGSTYRKQTYSVNNHLVRKSRLKKGEDVGGLQPVYRFFLIIKGKALWTRLDKTSITRSLSRYPIHEVKGKKVCKQSPSIITNLPGRFLHAE